MIQNNIYFNVDVQFGNIKKYSSFIMYSKIPEKLFSQVVYY